MQMENLYRQIEIANKFKRQSLTENQDAPPVPDEKATEQTSVSLDIAKRAKVKSPFEPDDEPRRQGGYNPLLY
jgi:hypothetical protein